MGKVAVGEEGRRRRRDQPSGLMVASRGGDNSQHGIYSISNRRGAAD